MHKARQSNIELLRIIAMLMVLLLHATFETFGYAHTSSITHAPWRWLSIITTAAACMQCVNVFVLITGWFGTSFKLKGLLRIVSECTFISLAMFVFMYLLGLPLPHQLYNYLKVIWSYWFVRAYVLLYLFTPVLNSFVQQSSEKQLRHFLVLFFTLSIPLSFVSSDLSRGFSTISFFGLYLLGRYMRLYLAPRLERYHTVALLMPYIVNTLIMSLTLWSTAFFAPQFHNWFLPLFTAYSNPLVIISAMSLLLFFTRLQFKSHIINVVAAGSFAAYLTHQQAYVRPHYFQLIKFIDQQTSSTALYALAITVTIITLFMASAMLDVMWQRVYQYVNTQLSRICTHKMPS